MFLHVDQKRESNLSEDNAKLMCVVLIHNQGQKQFKFIHSIE